MLRNAENCSPSQFFHVNGWMWLFVRARALRTIKRIELASGLHLNVNSNGSAITEAHQTNHRNHLDWPLEKSLFYHVLFAGFSIQSLGGFLYHQCHFISDVCQFLSFHRMLCATRGLPAYKSEYGEVALANSYFKAVVHCYEKPVSFHFFRICGAGPFVCKPRWLQSATKIAIYFLHANVVWRCEKSITKYLG